jgi:hypothetical protein
MLPNRDKREAMMQWPFKTTVKFEGRDGHVVRLQYAVCAMSESEAKVELQRRLLGQEVFGYTVEDIVAATGKEAAQLNLPDDCVQLLG